MDSTVDKSFEIGYNIHIRLIMKSIKETLLCALVGAIIAAVAYYGLTLSIPA